MRKRNESWAKRDVTVGGRFGYVLLMDEARMQVEKKNYEQQAAGASAVALTGTGDGCYLEKPKGGRWGPEGALQAAWWDLDVQNQA
ncbi:hypothetical protein VFPPC_17424 [Pochonia chlamydosporia 170]|uniref:Uncharacterized protein n=1 Tax=Pochonia chlamydosporia 170 TaxID=1380566 RepID=A0A219ARN9_METCM|nr:hypothetical protein VFPPC_17424 [Pochonia chlamydosporia 170]OWT43427.1 hypothetical protein VFPPC_17424 [Pochonia chlamydosporia 170]